MQKNLPKYLVASLCVLIAFFIPVYKAPLPDGVSVHPPKPKQIKAIADVLSPAIAEADPIVIETPKPAPSAPVAPTGVISGCGDNDYAHFIYMHESGCQLYNPNPQSGACGLGQAWPCSKLIAACPNLDYSCENAWFNDYANKYGGWAGSYAFWLAHSWW